MKRIDCAQWSAFLYNPRERVNFSFLVQLNNYTFNFCIRLIIFSSSVKIKLRDCSKAVHLRKNHFNRTIMYFIFILKGFSSFWSWLSWPEINYQKKVLLFNVSFLRKSLYKSTCFICNRTENGIQTDWL